MTKSSYSPPGLLSPEHTTFKEASKCWGKIGWIPKNYTENCHGTRSTSHFHYPSVSLIPTATIDRPGTPNNKPIQILWITLAHSEVFLVIDAANLPLLVKVSHLDSQSRHFFILHLFASYEPATLDNMIAIRAGKNPILKDCLIILLDSWIAHHHNGVTYFAKTGSTTISTRS